MHMRFHYNATWSRQLIHFACHLTIPINAANTSVLRMQYQCLTCSTAPRNSVWNLHDQHHLEKVNLIPRQLRNWCLLYKYKESFWATKEKCCPYFHPHTLLLPIHHYRLSDIYKHRLTLISAWIDNLMPGKVWDEIICPFRMSLGMEK